MRLTHILSFALAAATLSILSSARAALIDFETDPAAALPVDNAALSTPYNLAGGGTVQFFFDTNSNNSYDAGIDFDPLFEAAGADSGEGFSNGALGGIPDVANGGLGAQLGNFFLRYVVPGAIPEPFIIDYNTPQTITALSGEIWDIDGAGQATEQWLVEVLDSSNNLLTSQLSPLGNSSALDGLPWVLSFTGLPTGVDKLRITFLGTKLAGVGLAFNNFNPTAVPEPGGVVLMGLGAVALVAIGARRRRG